MCVCVYCVLYAVIVKKVECNIYILWNYMKENIPPVKWVLKTVYNTDSVNGMPVVLTCVVGKLLLMLQSVKRGTDVCCRQAVVDAAVRETWY